MKNTEDATVDHGRAGTWEQNILSPTEVDTGASSTVASEQEWNKLNSKPEMEVSSNEAVSSTHR